MSCPIRVLYAEPEIPGNTGSTIRLSALTGCELHLARPLGFDLDGAKLKRAGLDYHDMARVSVHESVDAALAALPGARVWAFTAAGTLRYSDVSYRPGDVLLFGRESTGLDPRVLADPRITATVALPMLPGRRSLNLASATAVVVYEAWRQLGFPGTPVHNRSDHTA